MLPDLHDVHEMIAVGLESSAAVAGVLSVAPTSALFALALAVLLVAAGAILVSRRGPSSRAAVSSETPSHSETPASPRTHQTTRPAENPDEPPPVDEADVSLPEFVDAQNVADALLASATRAGDPISCSIWRADGASEAAVRVIVAGSATPELAREDTIAAAIEKDSVLLEALTVESETSVSFVWRYVVPLSSGGIRGAAAIDFLETRPDMEVLSSIANVFRLPLTAALDIDSARLESEMTRTLIRCIERLMRNPDAQTIASIALNGALHLAEASTGSIMLYDESGTDLRIAAAEGLPSRIVDTVTVRPGDGIAGWVALSGQPLVVEDLPGRPTSAYSHGVRSAVSVPIADEEGVLGVLNVGSVDYPSRFTSTHLESLKTLARQTAIALRSAWTVSSVEDLCLDTLKALALALESKDPYAAGGTDRVMSYASRLGKVIGLSDQEMRILDVAAMLYDIGMSAVGETVMAYDRPLSTVERGLLKMHPVIAAEIIGQAPALRDVVPIVYHHHEHYDGTGYVAGLKKDEIPLGARILAVVDAFVAMTSDRPYRPAMTEHAAIKEIHDGAGTHFDPVVVETFTALVEEPQQERIEA